MKKIKLMEKTSVSFIFSFFTRFVGMIKKNNKQLKLCYIPVIPWNLLLKFIIL